MFEQRNLLEKIVRIIIFALFTLLIIIYVPKTQLDKEDMSKVIILMTIVFIFYDFYYPTVKIELKNEKDEVN